MKQSSHKYLHLDNEKWCKRDGWSLLYLVYCLYIDSIRKRPAQRERSRTTGMLKSSYSEDETTGTYGQRRLNRKTIRRKLVQRNQRTHVIIMFVLVIVYST